MKTTQPDPGAFNRDIIRNSTPPDARSQGALDARKEVEVDLGLGRPDAPISKFEPAT